ncbi:UDP-Glycosyltransferase/glycogen phosphorylase [Clavulina sp. PMI_390]|nr:UDP-Glycosyltransferase/glycogen phosphorylase [Clavulina sp. PMI_390]
MPLHQSVLPHRRKSIIFNSTSQPSQFNYMFGIAVAAASSKRLATAGVEIYFMTDDTCKELIESTPNLKFLSLGPKAEVQFDLSTVMSKARARPRDASALAGISEGFWTNPQIVLNNIERCHAHMKALRPMLVVLDQFSRALDGAMALRIPYLMCGNEVVPTSKPTDRSALKTLFTVPSMCTGFVGPMTWWQTFQNTFTIVHYISLLLRSPSIRWQARARRELLNEPNLPFATLDRSFGSDLEHGEIWAMPKSVLHPHAEYKTVFPVGPTFEAQFDPSVQTNLAGWLDEGPVIYINMGTLFKFTDADLHVFASTFHDLVQPSSTSSLPSGGLVTSNKHRFLWKLPSKPYARLFELYPNFLANEETHGRVRIETWIDFPHLVLSHPNTLAFVHHGGANSFIESAWYGVPQVILPMWADCYDTAAQAVRAGVAVSGLEREAPFPSVELFTELLLTLLARGDDGYIGYKRKAETLAEECRLAGGAGRAAEIIEQVFAREMEEWDGDVKDDKNVIKI